MSCNTRYWHSMACQKPDKPANPVLAQENNKNLQALLAAREAQDAKWSYSSQTVKQQDPALSFGQLRLVSSFTGD